MEGARLGIAQQERHLEHGDIGLCKVVLRELSPRAVDDTRKGGAFVAEATLQGPLADPLFAPDPSRRPGSTLTALGSVVLLLAGAFDPPNATVTVAAVPEAPNVAYGRYLAEDVYKCGDCHTPVCHATGAPFEDRLRGASGRPTADVAAWILNPERFRPGTAMPTFAGRLSETEALALAGWIQRKPTVSSAL